MSPEVIAAGFVVGVLTGLTGMGGGSLVTPMMIFVFGIQPAAAVGTDLVLDAITRAAGAVAHFRMKNVDLGMVRTLLSGSVPGAIAGLLLLEILPMLHIASQNAATSHALGAVLILVAAAMFFPSLWKYLRRRSAVLEKRKKDRMIRAVAFGVGVAVSLTSVGSGSLFVPFLLAVSSGTFSRVVGIGVFHGAILCAVAAAGHLAGGSVDLPLLTGLLIGSVPGAIIGSRMSLRFPRRATELLLGSLLLVSGFRLL